MTIYIEPSFQLEAFNCPHCRAYSHMVWKRLFCHRVDSIPSPYWVAVCSHCSEGNAWRQIDSDCKTAEMLYPDTGCAELPEEEMPENVKADYQEAAKIISRSPRGAAALLRLALQNLVVHLGEEGNNLDNDIRKLAAKGTLTDRVIKVADTVRLTGNASVHPGEMLSEDIDYVASRMFGLINHIVRASISEPKKLDELYKKTPESKRIAAEEKDKIARGKNQKE